MPIRRILTAVLTGVLTAVLAGVLAGVLEGVLAGILVGCLAGYSQGTRKGTRGGGYSGVLTHSQASLPRMPIPPLAKTIEKYLVAERGNPHPVRGTRGVLTA